MEANKQFKNNYIINVMDGIFTVASNGRVLSANNDITVALIEALELDKS